MAITEPLARIPPHNLDAEQAVLGIVLMEGAGVLPRIAGLLEANDFYPDAHRLIFETMLTMGAAGQPVDLVTLTEQLRLEGTLAAAGGPALLAFLMERATVSVHLSTYIQIVRAHAIRRSLIQESERRLAEAYEAQVPAADLLEATRTTLEQLAKRAVAGEQIFPVRSLAELRAAALPAPQYHLEGWILTKGVSFIVGDSGAFKSWFAKYLGLCKAAGRPMFDRLAVRQGPVLYISEENGEVEDRRRCDLLCRAFNFPNGIPFYIASETSFAFDDPARYQALRAFLEDKGIELVIGDSFIRLHRREEKDAGAMNALYMDRMKPLVHAGVDLLLLHHKRKLPAGLHGATGAQGGSDNDEIRGSGDLRAAAHSVLFLKTQSKTHVVVRHNKVRGAKTQDPYVFSLTDLDTGGIRLAWEGKPEDTLDRSAACKTAVLEYAGEHPAGFFRQDVIDALKGKFSKKVIQPVLKALSKDAYPLKEDELQQGRTKKKFYVLVSADPDPSEDGNGATDDVPF